MSLDALRALGREYDAAHAGEWERRIGLRKPEDLAILVYTSGTTGKPKGAMISHANIVLTCKAYQDAFPQDEHDERMAFLPLCHIAERVGGEYHSIYSGAVLNFVENPETVPENVREIAPTVFTAVPRVWEKFYSGVLIGLKQAGAVQQLAYKLAIGIGLRRARLREEGKPVPVWLEAAFWPGAPAGAEQRAETDRRAPREGADHRRGAHLARPDPLVHGARPGDVRSLGADRVLRCGDLEHRRQGEAGFDRAAHVACRGQGLRRGRAAGARQDGVHGLPEPAREDRRDAQGRLAAHRRRRQGGRGRAISTSPTA